ncbi:MAG: VCBS repeat-containing protein [Polyangiaceae bacterium]
MAVDAADVDGDGRTDLVTHDGSSLQIRFHEADGTPAKTHSFSAAVDRLAPAFGDLTGDGRADAVVALGEIGVGVLVATPDRSLSPVVQGSIDLDLPDDGSRLLAVDALSGPGAEHAGDETLAILPTSAGGADFALYALNQDENAGQPTVIATLPAGKAALDIEGAVPAGDFDHDPLRPCPEVVIGFRGDDRVRIYTPCADAQSYASGEPPRTVTLPDGHQLAGAVFVADVNGDDRLDVLLPARDGDQQAVLDVAFGLGDGTFHSDPTALPAPGLGDDAASPVVALSGAFTEPTGSGSGGDEGDQGGALVLAVGDINGDQRADLVTGWQLVLSVAVGSDEPPAFAEQTFNSTSAWTVAAIGDFNGNGLADVIAGSEDVAGLDFLNGAGQGKFNPFDVPTQRPVRRLATGDFDGDLLLDVAFAETTGSDGLDALSFAFGSAFGPPEPPVRAGALPRIEQLLSGDRLLKFLIGGGSPDAMSELVVVSLSGNGESGSISVVPGSSDRRLQSPYIFFREVDGDSQPAAPLAMAIGQLTEGDTMADLVALTFRLDNAAPELWGIPSAGGGRFLEPEAASLADEEADFFSAALVVGELDELGAEAPTDEILLLTTTWFSSEPHGTAVVLRSDGDGGFPAEGSATTPRLGNLGRPAALLADVDGDGYQDLLARAATDVFVDGVDVGGDGVELYLFWNDGGTLAWDHPVPLGLPEGEYLSSFCALNADGDAGREILAVGYGGVWRFDAERETRALSRSEMPPGVAGGAGVAVSGDFDGDGVDDFALASFDLSTTVFFGVPVEP